MTTAALPRRLGDLALLAQAAATLPPLPVAARVVRSADMLLCPDIPDLHGAVPVVVGERSALPWAVAAIAHLCGDDVPALVPDQVDGEGQLDHDSWAELCASARDAACALRPHAGLPERLVDEIRDAGFQAVLGFMRRTSADGLLVLVDGPVAAAATLVLEAAAPGQTAHVLGVQRGATQIEERVWARLERNPILPWRTELVDGELADLALSAVTTAASLSGGVSEPGRLTSAGTASPGDRQR